VALFNILVNVAARTAELESELRHAEGRLNSFGDVAKKALGGLSLGVVIHEIGEYTEATLRWGEETLRSAKKAGVTAEAFTQLSFVAKLSGLSADELSGAFVRMNRSLSLAQTGASGPVRDALKALGLTLDDIKGQAPDQVFELIADQLIQLKNPGDQARAAMALFGRSFTELLPLLEKGRAGIEKARLEAVRFHQSFSAAELQQLAEAKEEIEKMDAAFSGMARTLVSKVAPALTEFFKEMNEMATGDKTAVASRKIQALTETLAQDKGTFLGSTSLGSILGTPQATTDRLRAELVQLLQEEVARKAPDIGSAAFNAGPLLPGQNAPLSRPSWDWQGIRGASGSIAGHQTFTGDPTMGRQMYEQGAGTASIGQPPGYVNKPYYATVTPLEKARAAYAKQLQEISSMKGAVPESEMKGRTTDAWREYVLFFDKATRTPIESAKATFDESMKTIAAGARANIIKPADVEPRTDAARKAYLAFFDSTMTPLEAVQKNFANSIEKLKSGLGGAIKPEQFAARAEEARRTLIGFFDDTRTPLEAARDTFNRGIEKLKGGLGNVIKPEEFAARAEQLRKSFAAFFDATRTPLEQAQGQLQLALEQIQQARGQGLPSEQADKREAFARQQYVASIGGQTDYEQGRAATQARVDALNVMRAQGVEAGKLRDLETEIADNWKTFTETHLTRSQKAMRAFADDMSQAFRSLFDEGGNAAKNFARQLVTALQNRIIFKAIEEIGKAIYDALNQKAGEGGSSWLGAIVQGIGYLWGGESGSLAGFSGGSSGGAGGGGSGRPMMAAGGPVLGGGSYLVGEQGAELFTPASNGVISPAGSFGGHTVVINNSVDARGATTDLVAALPTILRRNNEGLENKIVDGLRRRRYGL